MKNWVKIITMCDRQALIYKDFDINDQVYVVVISFPVSTHHVSIQEPFETKEERDSRFNFISEAEIYEFIAPYDNPSTEE